MLSRWLKRLSIVSLSGTAVFGFLLLAGVTCDDLRLKLGALRPLPSPDVAVGSFYSVFTNGSLAGPHCRTAPEALSPFVVKTESEVALRNELGASLPIVAAWSAGLMGADGLVEVGALRAEGAASGSWAGHTLRVRRILSEALASTTDAIAFIDASFISDLRCEATLRERYERGECVALVYRVARTPTAGLGYEFFDETRCFVPSVSGGRPNAPSYLPRAARLTAWLSRVKDSLGLLDEEMGNAAGPPGQLAGGAG